MTSANIQATDDGISINGPTNAIATIIIGTESGQQTLSMSQSLNDLSNNTEYSLSLSGVTNALDVLFDNDDQVTSLNVALPFWLAGEDIHYVKAAAESFWNKINQHAQWQNTQIDPLTCNEELLTLLAWERDLERFADETLDIFRFRVNYAYANAKDAGSAAGMIAIFERLGIDIIALYERHYVTDWDVITIQVTEQQLSENNDLFNQIINQYGRTCRRYEFATEANTTLNLANIEFNGSQEFTEVTYVPV